MKIIRASHLGMCFGVKDAITLGLDAAQRAPLMVLGDLVHNETVLARLRAGGVRFEQNPSAIQTESVMVTAHGASEKTLENIRRGGRTVIEATCPLVRVAHRALARLVGEGFHPVVIGKRDHVEVRGMTEDLAEFDVILNEEDVANLHPRCRFGVVAQTTQPIERAHRLVETIRKRFPEAEVRFIDTVCQPTKLRQNAAEELARVCDAVIVIGGPQSNNTEELAATCRLHCGRVYKIQTAEGLHPL